MVNLIKSDSKFKLDKDKIYEALKLIETINKNDILNLDFSDLFDGKDLTKEQKINLCWANERKTNVDIIKNLKVK